MVRLSSQTFVNLVCFNHAISHVCIVGNHWQWANFTMGPNEQNQHFAELRQKVCLYIHILVLPRGLPSLDGKLKRFLTKKNGKSCCQTRIRQTITWYCFLVFQETLVKKLVEWAEKEESPLCFYATGLLAGAMEIQDLAANFKDNNATLVRRGHTENYQLFGTLFDDYNFYGFREAHVFWKYLDVVSAKFTAKFLSADWSMGFRLTAIYGVDLISHLAPYHHSGQAIAMLALHNG